MKLIFERSVPGRHCTLLPDCDCLLYTSLAKISAAGSPSNRVMSTEFTSSPRLRRSSMSRSTSWS